MTRILPLLPFLELGVALAAGGLWYLQGGARWYVGPWPGPIPALVMAALWGARYARLRPRPRLSAFDVALLSFVATAALGVWVAYDRGPALAKFWLIFGAVAVYYALARLPSIQHIHVGLALFAVLGALVALYFLSTNDWSGTIDKAPGLVAVGERWLSWLPAIPGHRMHPNTVAGFLVVLLPLCVPLVCLLGVGPADGMWGALRPRLGWIGVTCLVVGGVGLLFSMSRGAWVAAAAAGGCWCVWALAGRLVRRNSLAGDRAWRARTAITAGTLVAIGLLAAVVGLLVLDGRLHGPASVASRVDLLRNSLLLAGDYAFTGAGLGMYPLQYSVYTMLIHVLHTTHSHNMLLNVAIDQGILGLGAFCVMIGLTWIRGLRGLRESSHHQSRIVEAGMASLIALLVHGLVNDLYSARTVLLLLVPFGVVAASASLRPGGLEPPSGEVRRLKRRLPLGLLTAGLAVAIIVLWRPLLAAVYANLGALSQSRVELGAYDPDEWASFPMDQVRRSEDLDHATRLLHRATMVDPSNRTARQRLAAIALSRAQYDDALRQAEAGWEAGHRDDVTRLLLGDALVAHNLAERAAAVTRGHAWAERRLLGNGWYRYWVEGDYQRAATSASAVLLLDPENEAAAELLLQAQAQIGE